MKNALAIKINPPTQAVAIFDDAESLQAAIDELQTYGFDHRYVSMLADAKVVETKLGHVYKRAQEVAVHAEAPHMVFEPLESISETEGALLSMPLFLAATAAGVAVVVSGGTLLTVILAVIAGGAGGGLIGGVLSQVLAKQHADYIQAQIERGSVVLWVTTEDEEDKERALNILRKHSAHDVHIHNIVI